MARLKCEQCVGKGHRQRAACRLAKERAHSFADEQRCRGQPFSAEAPAGPETARELQEKLAVRLDLGTLDRRAAQAERVERPIREFDCSP
jgi:hypothetical protein